jgi:hypothetical protein
MDKPYVITKHVKAICPMAHRLDLLSPLTTGPGPIFFVCWTCDAVFQAGVGLVPVEGS